MNDLPIRCSCGKLYYIHSMYCGDQSVCPDCRAALKIEYEKQNSDFSPVDFLKKIHEVAKTVKI